MGTEYVLDVVIGEEIVDAGRRMNAFGEATPQTLNNNHQRNPRQRKNRHTGIQQGKKQRSHNTFNMVTMPMYTIGKY